MRTVFGCLALLALASVGASADDPIEPTMLLGKWELVQAKSGQQLTLEFTTAKDIVVTVEEAGKETRIEGKYEVVDRNKIQVNLKFMSGDIRELLTVRKLTSDELVTVDSKGKSETLKKKKSG